MSWSTQWPQAIECYYTRLSGLGFGGIPAA